MTLFAGFTVMILISAFAMGWRPEVSTKDEDAKAPPPPPDPKPDPDAAAERQEAMAKIAYEAVKDLEDPEKLDLVADHYPNTFSGRLAATDARKLRRIAEEARLAREEQERQARYACTTEDGEPGIKFGGKCWPLDTTKIGWGNIPHSVRCEITDASPLAGLTGLQFLNLSDTKVRDVTPLSGLTELQTLFLVNTQVSDMTPLSGLTGLHFLWAPDGKRYGDLNNDTPANRAAVAEAIRAWRLRR